MPNSTAIGQRRVGEEGGKVYPLFPVLTDGAPQQEASPFQYPLEIAYEYDAVDVALFDQSPLPGLERWQPLLPPLTPGLSFGEGGTPLIALPESATGRGGPVFLKDESRNPTWSHKDRLNLCTVSAALASDAAGVVVASSGNHGASAAAYAARAGLRCLVLIPTEISTTFHAMLRAYGAFPVPVLSEHRWPLVKKMVEHAGFHPASNLSAFHTGHPFGPEGYKTIAYELYLQLGRRVPGTVVVPTGYAEQLFGIAKGFDELVRFGLTSKVPQMIAVEPEARGPLYHAMASNEPMASVPAYDTRQFSIACTTGGYRGVHVLGVTHGRALKVNDAVAEAAQRKLGALGIWQELSSCAAVAALPQLLPGSTDDPVVVMGTSGGFKDPVSQMTFQPVEPTFEGIVNFVMVTYGVNLA